MAFKNNNDNDNLQNTKHCVLIDGSFGRHELFNNIHPYTIGRLGKVTDVFTFSIYVNGALELMNNWSNVHYHICYNSSSAEIDEYYKVLKMVYPQSVWLHSLINTTADANINQDNALKFKEIISEYEYDYVWIIHGIENRYERLLEQLKSDKNSKANISSYSWLENLKEGSNRIEYLVNNKIKYQTKHRIEQPNVQPVVTEPITLATEPTEQEKKSKTKIKCDINGCEKEFKSVSALKSHQLAKHSSTQAVINEETTATAKAKGRKKRKKIVACDIKGCDKTFRNLNALKAHQLAKHTSPQSVINDETPTTTTSETKKSNENGKKPKRACSFDNCKQSYKKLTALQIHQIQAHPIPIRCLFSQECVDSNERYLGMQDLSNHLAFQHADSFPRQNCPIVVCKSKKSWHDWSAALQHMLQKHSNYLLSDIIPNTAEPISMTDIPCWDIMGPYKCSYSDCSYWNWEEESLKRHEAYEHPVPFLCPFNSECAQSARKYNGLWRLRRHVMDVHAPLFSQPTCFDSECKTGEKQPFKSWPDVFRHILLEHLSAVGIIMESAASSTKKTGTKYKKCCYDTCNILFKTREKFQHHLTRCHPYPFRCPYNSECNNIADGKVYAGLMDLTKHITEKHSVQFSKPVCFDSKCQNEKHFQDWNLVMEHILRKHWLEIKSN